MDGSFPNDKDSQPSFFLSVLVRAIGVAFPRLPDCCARYALCFASLQFIIGSDEEEEEEEVEEKACGSPCPLPFHVAEECSHLSPLPYLSDLLPEKGPISPKR